MCTIENNEFWRGFLKLFRQQPSLWKLNSDLYKNKFQRDKSIKILLSKLQEIIPAATVDDLKKRLKNLRTSYRREVKKVQRSQRSGVPAEEQYVPRLWYFEELEFLRDQKLPKRRKSTLDTDDEGSGPSEIQINPELHWTEFSKMAREPMRSRDVKPLDSLEIFAAGWVAKLRTMDENQQRYARMAIDQILLQGECQTLSLASVASIASAMTFSTPQPQPIGQLQYPLQHLLQQLQQPLQQLHQLLHQLQQPQPAQFPLQLQTQNPLQPQNSLHLQGSPINHKPPNSQELREFIE